MEICVIGTGYVGLVTGAVFADLGNFVICADIDASKIDMLKRGEMPIYEPGLEEMVRNNIGDGRLTFTTDIDDAICRSTVIFICVGTPPKDNGETDLAQVAGVAHRIAAVINQYKVIVNKSTVPVGTGDFVSEIIERNKQADVDFDVVSNPEFLREGSAINDTLYPERIVIGAPSQTVAMILLELYAPLERPMIITDIHSAEMIKYASNAFLATKISFVNAIADLCEKVGADITLVAKGMGLDERIGNKFLSAGLGYGGSCFPKDVKSLIHTADFNGVEFKLLKAVEEINASRATHYVERIKAVLGDLRGLTFAMLGLAFKPNTDDMREAKSVEIIRLLLAEGAQVRAYDPVAMENCRREFFSSDEVYYAENPYDALDGADAMLLITEWNEFKFLKWERVRELLRRPIVFDGRNLYKPEYKRRLGLEYHGIGR
jgi:UDPglucose 6-dehydrogenase